MPTPLRVISSMATKPLLADLVLLFKAHAPDCMAEVVKRIPSEDLIAVSSWLARQALPADTHPAPRPPAGPPLPAALRCGSAPELSSTPGGQP